MRQRSFSLVLIVALALVSVACNAREAAIDAFLAVSTAAITANQTTGSDGQPLLSTADTGKVLTYANQALAVLETQPKGWQATVKVGWAAAEADLSTKVKTQLKAALAVIDAAVAAL